jgi:acetyl-CoA carboxylase biotin carboxyl carrier protein
MDLRKIKSLVELMNENALSEVELEEEGMKVRLRKFGGDAAPAPAALPGVPAPVAPAKPEKAPPTGPLISSPMVGTFYRASGPEAKPFVDVGTVVGKDTGVCIIEAMKVMNEIKAECEGTIEEILVQNGQAVEFGQPLFRLRV